jgi:hypothetical protein
MLASNTNNPSLPGQSPLQQRPGWFSRTFLRQPSTASDGSSTKSEKKIKTKRSISDLALRVVNGTKKDGLQDEDLQSLVRLCGKSKLYLPSEYSPCSLVLPTCFRATAQYLIQHGRHSAATGLGPFGGVLTRLQAQKHEVCFEYLVRFV